MNPLPKADEIFRPTAVPDALPDIHVVEADELDPGRPPRPPSGRMKHDEKMTVYITSDELLELEHARLVLRRTLGSAVDRGRIVRAAISLALADLDVNGEDSALVRRLNQA
jgi:hypothetical protein